jgi:signal transduction histidine kinase
MNHVNFNPSDMKVLIVDDTLANVELLTSSLKPIGYQLAVATSGEKALKIAERFQPDIILLDVMMPGMDGFETCRQLKASATTQNIPVIFVTAKVEAEDVIRGLRLGAVDYVTKPFREEEIHARVRTHLLLKYSLDALTQANVQKDKLLGMVAHDLRSPISGIHGYSEILLDDSESVAPAERKEMLAEVISACNSMLTLVNDLLDSSAIAAGTLTLNKRSNNLAELIKQRVNIARFTATKKSITLVDQITASPVMHFDERRIGQVLDNLISNAVKFSPANSCVTIRVAATPTGAEIAIDDEGPGLTESDQQKLFSAFQPLSARPTGGEVSTGLGLAIVKKVIDAHGGTITTRRRPEKGTSFIFTLANTND